MLGYHAAIVTRCDSRANFDACPCYGYSAAGFSACPCCGYSATAGSHFGVCPCRAFIRWESSRLLYI